MVPRYHYAWAIVALMSVIQMAGGAIRNTFGVLVVPLEDKFGWSQGDVTGAYAVSSIVSAVLAPLAGWMADRYGDRKTLALGIGLFGGGMALAGATTQLWHLYVAYGLLLGAALSIFLVVMVTAAMAWFKRGLGLAIGILMCLNGVGPAVAAPLISYLLEATDWKFAFWTVGFAGTGLMSVMLLFFRNRPADMGLRPYGASAGDDAHEAPLDKAAAKIRTALFRKEVQRTNAFWNLIAIHFLGCVGHVIVIVYVVAMATHAGVGATAAAGIITVLSMSSLLSRLVAPVMGDRLGGKISMGICFLVQGVTVIALFGAQEVWQFYLFAALFGVGLGGEMSVFPIINRQYYGEAPLGVIYGWQSLGGGAGMALGGWLGGVIFDLTGAYTIAIWLSIICSLSGAVLILFLEPTKKLLVRPWHGGELPPEPQSPISTVAVGGHAD